MRWLVMLLLSGCHFGWSAWQGATPRRSNAVRVALYTPDASSKDLAHQALARDPHVTVIDFDPAVLPAEDRGTCSEATCSFQREAACAWAKSQQLDYYIVGAAIERYDQDYKCTAYDHSLGKLLEDDDPECIKGHYENQHTAATFSLEVYPSETCELASTLSTKITTVVNGEEEISRPAARSRLQQEAPVKTVPFPDQIEVTAAGTVEASDGYYALYRDRHYRGFVAVSARQPKSLHCCDEPSAGDVLVARGERKLVELAVDGVVGSMTFDGGRHVAGGAGAHVRYYPLDTGMRFGFGVDIVGSPGAGANALISTPEIGWGFRPSSAFSLSANLGLGWVQATQVIASMDDAVPRAFAPHVLATVRAVSFFAKWWYVGADVGYLHSGTLDSWEGAGAAAARPMTLRTPLLRAWLGVDL